MATTSAPSPRPLDHTFTATLRQSPVKGGWTYVVMDESAVFFATRGLVKVSRTMLPINAIIRSRLGKQTGDIVTVHLEQRLN